MSSHPELDVLVEGVRGRDDRAFADLHRLVSDALFAYANAMVRDRKTAEDVVQQAFLELVRAAPTLRGDGRSLRAWLFRSVRFSCLDELRRRGRRPEYPTADLPERPDVAAIGPDLGWDPDLEAALAELDDRERSLVVLKHVVGMSGGEVADVLDLSRTAVYAATRRAERRLEHILASVESERSASSSPEKDHEGMT